MKYQTTADFLKSKSKEDIPLFLHYIELVGINTVIDDIFDIYSFEINKKSEPVKVENHLEIWTFDIDLKTAILTASIIESDKANSKPIIGHFYRFDGDKMNEGTAEYYQNEYQMKSMLREILKTFLEKYVERNE
jgi:hypothetical protein